jgi:hypothetical protein
VSSSYDSAIIDTAMIHHPDLLRVSSAARFLYVEGTVWAKLNKTDGRIPKYALRLVSIEADAEVLAASLVAVGRWLDDGDSWVIVDFLENQWSAERVARKRASNRDRLDRFYDNESKRVSKRVSTGSYAQDSELKRVTKRRRYDPTRPDPKGRREGGARYAGPPVPGGGGPAPRARRPMSDETKAKIRAASAATRERKRIEAEQRAIKAEADAVELQRQVAEQQQQRDAEWLRLGGSPDDIPVTAAQLQHRKNPGRRPLR